jgi:hypothetical protein
MIRPVQFYDPEKAALTKDMTVEAILEFLENVRKMTPEETYWEIHREYVEGFRTGWK